MNVGELKRELEKYPDDLDVGIPTRDWYTKDFDIKCYTDHYFPPYEELMMRQVLLINYKG